MSGFYFCFSLSLSNDASCRLCRVIARCISVIASFVIVFDMILFKQTSRQK